MTRLKPVFKCDESYKAMFLKSRCLMTVSVGQEVHEGEHFEVTVQLVNESFDEVIILVDDTLQRHTMALEKGGCAKDYDEFALAEGDNWLVRNQCYINQLGVLIKILRWDHFLKHEKFSAMKSKLLNVYENNPEYRDIFVQTIEEFLVRYYRRLLDKSNFDMERARQLCLNYLIEECVALCLWPELSCHFEVYPSRRNFVMAETHRRFVVPIYPDLLHAVSIKFKNRKQLKSQKFAQLDGVVD